MFSATQEVQAQAIHVQVNHGRREKRQHLADN
jgi:hypothetical protein